MKLFNQKKTKSKNSQKLKFKKNNFFSKKRFIPVAIIFGIIGGYFVFQSFAYTPSLLGSDGEFTPLTPVNIMDTRNGVGGYSVALPANQTYSLQVTGNGGIPEVAKVKSVVLSITTLAPSSNGYLTVWPSNIAKPNSSNINFSANQTISNQVTVPVGTDGKIQIFSSATTHVTVDISGYYSSESGQAGSRFNSLPPFRALDTRNGTGGFSKALGKDGVYTVQLTGKGGVPQTGVSAIVFNITAVKPTTDGFATIYPSGSTRPNTSSINFMQGKTVAKLVTISIGPDGKATLYNSSGSTHYLIDIAGYYDNSIAGGDSSEQAGRFVPVTPARVMDTRNGTGGYSVAIPANKTYNLNLSGNGGVPLANSVKAVVLNIAAVSPTGEGYITAWPSGTPKPTTSNINFTSGQTTANQTIVKMSSSGVVQLTSPVSTHIIVDVVGYFVDYGDNATPIAVNTEAIPANILSSINRNVISFNGCTANYVRNEDDSILGVVTAKHCLNNKNLRETLWKGSVYQTGASVDIPQSKMIIDPILDIIYFGLNGVSAQDVKQQMLDNYNLANLANVPINSRVIMSGFPYYNNPDKSIKTINLSYGGIARWNDSHDPFIVTFGNWVNNISCTNRSSGSGAYIITQQGTPLLIGVLTDHAEFSPVLTITYSRPDYGLELRTSFESQIGRKIQPQYMCAFEAPVQV